MKIITCIVCPNGCELTVDGNEISGNLCKKGIDFAVQEMNNPKRVVCSTLRTEIEGVPVVPCRTNKEVPKEKMFDVMREINQYVIKERLKSGSVVIKNVAGTDADIITTANM